MDKYINGNLIKRILVFKTRKHPEWKHRIADTKFLFWKRHIDLEFSERHDESIYFDSDEKMEGWLESFRQEFGKPFIYIE